MQDISVKTKATNLQAYLVQQGFTLPHGKSLEAIAKLEGFKNYRTMRGSFKPRPDGETQALPYGIEIRVVAGGGTLDSDLYSELVMDDDSDDVRGRAKASADAIESFLLAMACAGIDVASPQMKTALVATVEAIGNSLD